MTSRLAAAAALALFVARPAAASSPFETYVVPTKVELSPSDPAATHVVIHGAFFQLASTTDMKYGDPKCGYMTFDCVAGQETMCRMQWKELRDWKQTPGLSLCAGFGMRDVASNAPVHPEGEPLGKPDLWDLGMGIGQGQWVDGKCPMAVQLQCTTAGSDGGAMQPGTPDATPAEPDAPASASDTGSVSPPERSTSPPPQPDAGAEPAPKPARLSGDRSGCSLSGGPGADAAVIGLGLVALGCSRRRRR